MPHSLLRLKNKIDNKPHLMELHEFEQVLAYLDKSINGREVKTPEPKMEETATHNSRYSIYEDDNAALFTIEGPMTKKPVTLFGMDCGGFSYEQFKEDFRTVADSGVKTVGFMLDSGGGEADSLFDTANYVRALADENGIKIISYVDSLAASACYGIAAISDEIIMSGSSTVGSIGVVLRLINDSEALKKEGYERVYVTAGKDKVPFDADGKFKDSFLADIKEKIDVMYGEFTEHVAKYRNISVEQVKATEARTYLSTQALELGLADSSMTLEQFYSYFAKQAESRVEGNMLPKKLFNFNMKNDEETLEMTQLADLQSQLTAANEQLAEFSSVKEAHATLLAAFTEKETLLATALSEVAQMKEAVASAEAAAVAVKMDARKSKLAAVMSADKLEGVSASLSSLDDSAFETVLSGFAAQKQALEASDMFTEIGDQGTEAVAEPTSKAKTSTEDLIKQKLGLK
jgi:ClpP class serine protease